MYRQCIDTGGGNAAIIVVTGLENFYRVFFGPPQPAAICKIVHKHALYTSVVFIFLCDVRLRYRSAFQTFRVVTHIGTSVRFLSLFFTLFRSKVVIAAVFAVSRVLRAMSFLTRCCY